MTDRLQPLPEVRIFPNNGQPIYLEAAAALRMTSGEVAAAFPSGIPPSLSVSDLYAEWMLLKFERNAYRQRCHALERTVSYLLGREPELETLDRTTQTEAQRDMLLELLAAHAPQTLPAAS